MKTDALFWFGVSAVGVAVGLELADRFWRPIPLWRKARGPVAAFLAGVWAVLVFRKTPKPEPKPKPPRPKEYDDAKATQTRKDAADLDLDHADAEREAAEARNDTDARDARASARDDLLRELGGADTADFD